MIASSLTGVVSQRLVRKLCSECSFDDEPTPTEIVMFKKQGIDIGHVRRAKGCPSCNYKGYAGRIGIFEVLPISDELQKLIAENAGLDALEKRSKTFRDDKYSIIRT